MPLDNFFNAKELVAFHGKIKQSRKPFLGELFFPNKRYWGYDLTWIKGYQSRNVVLSPSTLDTKEVIRSKRGAEAVIRSKRGAEKVKTEFPYFKESMRLSETERREMHSLGNLNSPKLWEEAMLSVYRQYEELINGAHVQCERMRMALLSSGAFDVEANSETGQGVRYGVNYDPDGEWESKNKLEILGTSAWTNHGTSDPLRDIVNAKDEHASKNGTQTAYLLMTTGTFRNIRNSDSVKKAVAPLGGTVMKSAVKNLLEDETGAKILFHDQVYTDEFGIEQKFFPDGYVTFLPEGSVGNTCFGITPTESDVLGSLVDESMKQGLVAITEEGIAVTSEIVKDPVNIETIVSAYCIPTFERMNQVFVLKGY